MNYLIKALQLLHVVARIHIHFFYMGRWFDRNYIMVVLFMGQLCSRFFVVLTPLITWVYDFHLMHCELLSSRVSILSLMREKLALQYYTHLQPCPSNPPFECTIIPQYKLFLLEWSWPFQLLVLEINQYYRWQK